MNNPSSRKSLFLIAAIASIGIPLRAGQLSLYYSPTARVEYEGTGYRQVDSGWELKTKPLKTGQGLRWRHEFSDSLALQISHWRNDPTFFSEDGNTQGGPMRQTGQTKLALNNFFVDLRRPLFDSAIEAVGGMQGAHVSLRRKSIVFNLASESGSPRETLSALGPYIGFHGSGYAPSRLVERDGGSSKVFYWDWELTLGHFFWTQNTQKTDGGSIHRGGYSYNFRIEGGWRRGNWGLGVGYAKQMLEITVPGGKALPTGAAASLPINKFDFASPFVTVNYEY